MKKKMTVGVGGMAILFLVILGAVLYVFNSGIVPFNLVSYGGEESFTKTWQNNGEDYVWDGVARGGLGFKIIPESNGNDALWISQHFWTEQPDLHIQSRLTHSSLNAEQGVSARETNVDLRNMNVRFVGTVSASMGGGNHGSGANVFISDGLNSVLVARASVSDSTGVRTDMVPFDVNFTSSELASTLDVAQPWHLIVNVGTATDDDDQTATVALDNVFLTQSSSGGDVPQTSIPWYTALWRWIVKIVTFGKVDLNA